MFNPLEYTCKTYQNSVGTQTHLSNWGHLMEYCLAAGFRMIEYDEGAFRVMRPSSWTLRMYLTTLKAEQVENLEVQLAAFNSKRLAAREIGAIMKYARERRRLNANEKACYVNLALGITKDDNELIELRDYMVELGYRSDIFEIVPTPFIRATHGNYISTMPLNTQSVYDGIVSLLPQAEVLCRPDPLFELEGRNPSVNPLVASGDYGSHAFRQMADASARRHMVENGATEIDIDRFFGWNEKQYERNMQLHYAGRQDRIKRKRLTRFV